MDEALHIELSKLQAGVLVTVLAALLVWIGATGMDVRDQTVENGQKIEALERAVHNNRAGLAERPTMRDMDGIRELLEQQRDEMRAGIQRIERRLERIEGRR